MAPTWPEVAMIAIVVAGQVALAAVLARAVR